MRLFARNINARRNVLGLTYEDVHERLLNYQWPEGVKAPSLATVGHWFNGTRSPRDMRHLRALCDVLDTDLDTMTKDAPGEAVTTTETAVLMGMRQLTDQQAETLLALIHSMLPKKDA